MPTFHQIVIAPAQDEIVVVMPLPTLSPESLAAFRAGLFLPEKWALPVLLYNRLERGCQFGRRTHWRSDTSRWSATYVDDECQPVTCGIKESSSLQIHASSHRKD
jgi:hypothetical protein